MEINGKKYNLKYSLRSMFAFEEITGKAFSIDTLLDTYCFCYACIISGQDNPPLDFNEFIDACDENPGIIEEFNKFIDGEMKRRNAFNKKKVKTEEKSSR